MVGKNAIVDGCRVVDVIVGRTTVMCLIEFSGRGSAKTLFVFHP
jgi:hypothetical protein